MKLWHIRNRANRAAGGRLVAAYCLAVAAYLAVLMTFSPPVAATETVYSGTLQQIAGEPVKTG